MPKVLTNYKEHLLNNLIYDDFFIGAKSIYIDLVVINDLTAMLIPNKINLREPLIDFDLKGFEAVIIPTGINLLDKNELIYKLSYDVLIEKLPGKEQIKGLLDKNRTLIEEFKNTIIDK